MSANVIELMLPHVKAHPEIDALRWPAGSESPQEGQHECPLQHESISWAELLERVERASRGLSERGFKPGDKALLFIPMSVDLYVAMFAVFRLGGVAVFVDAFARQTQLENCAKLADPTAFFGSPEAHFLRVFLPESLGKVPIQVVSGGESAGAVGFDELEAGSSPIPPIAQVEGTTTALVSFTTGSSGMPKGANRTHAFLRAQHKALAAELPWREGAADMPAFPIFLLHNIACGLTTVIPAVNFTQPAPTDAPMALRQLLHGKIDTASMSPALLESVAKAALKAKTTLKIRRMITGGAPIGPQQVRVFQEAAPDCELLLLYGSTEAEPIAHITGAEMLHWLDNEQGFSSQEGVCVGHISDQVSLALLEIHKSPIVLQEGSALSDFHSPKGQAGEVVVAGDHVCIDYYQNPEAFHENKIREGDRIWHRTGDVGRFDSQGRLWLVGRVHNAISRNGELHFPVRPEQLLRKLEAVKMAAYVGLPDPVLGEKSCVAWTGDPDIGDRIEACLQEAGIPIDTLFHVDTLPMDPRHNSKVNYSALRDQLLAT